MPETPDNIRTAYSLAADAYAEKFLNELDFKPRDVELLNQLANLIDPQSKILDLGCGPGHTTAKLAELGLQPIGIDLSPGMVAKARSLFPHLEFVEGDFFELVQQDNSIGGILAFYCIVHLRRDQLKNAFREMKRVLAPSGILLLSFHIGSENVVVEKFLETDATLEFSPFQVNEVSDSLKSVGLDVVEIINRPPYQTEYPTDRCNIFARKDTEAAPIK